MLILGGTFDPIHIGHLRPAEEVREALKETKVTLIPAGNPPHRATPATAGNHRLAMARLAVEPYRDYEVLDWEVTKSTPSYAVETLARLRAQAGPQEPLSFMMGTDAFLRFDTWQDWQGILDLVHLVVTRRPGWAEPEFPDTLRDVIRHRQVLDREILQQTPAGAVLFQSVTPLSISATQIRHLLRAGKNPRFLLPDPVLQYIHTHKLYRDEREAAH